MVSEIRYEAFPSHQGPELISLFHSMRFLGLSRRRERAAKCNLRIERSGFVVKTLDSEDEILAALRLRHTIFHQEQNGRTLPSGLDVDEIDQVCDHLAVIEMATGRVIGAYRLTSSVHSSLFYSSKRFELGRFLDLPGVKLELGRACVDKSYRNGIVLHLLWRGVIEYAKRIGARYLFGSASLRTVKPADARAVYEYLRQEGHTSSAFPLTTRPQHLALSGQQDAVSDEEVHRLIPPLFQSYLRAGAKICSEPALDSFLGSTDFLVVLDREAVAEKFFRRFG